MATVTATDFLVATGTPGLWVRLHNNVSGTDYYSTAISDPQGSFTYSVPAGDYSLYVGAVQSVPGTPTLRSAHYQVAIRNGDDGAVNSLTSTIGPYGAFLPGAPTIPTPAGITTGKVWDWGGAEFNVMAANAKGDGVTDDTTALNTTCTSVPATGGTVKVPDGTFMVNAVSTSGVNDNPNAGVRVRANTRFVMSQGAILKCIVNTSGTYSVLRTQDENNILIEGGSVLGDRSAGHVSGQWGFGIIVNGGDNITIRSVKVTNCFGDGIALNASTANTANAPTNVRVEGCTSDSNERIACSVIAGDGVVIAHNTFSNTNGLAPQNGIDIEPATAVARSVKVIGNHVFGNVGHGIQTTSATGYITIADNTVVAAANVSGISTNNTPNLSITGNTVRDAVTNGQAGILVYQCQATVSGNVVRNCYNGVAVNGGNYQCVVANNNLQLCLGDGLHLTANYVLAIGNVIISPTSDGIYTSAALRCQLLANQIFGAGNNGIEMLSASNFCTIANNYVQGSARQGIILDGSATDCLVENNYCLENSQLTNNTYDNIQISLSTNHSVIGNTCRQGSLANKPKYGIDIGAGANTCFVANNDVTSGGNTANIVDAGTGTIIRSNRGWNPKGAVTTPGFPATTVAVTNTTGYDAVAYGVNGANALTVQVDAVAALMIVPANAAFTVRIPAASTFTPTYGGGVPVWKWYGE